MNMRAESIRAGSLVPDVLSKRSARTRTEGLSTVAITREESRRSNNRASDRHRLFGETVSIIHQGQRCQGELINLSGGGAMIARPPQRLKLWDPLDLILGDQGTIECAVRWVRKTRVGLEFAHETQLLCPHDQRASVLRSTIKRSLPHMIFDVPVREPAEEEAVPREGDHRFARRHALIWNAVLHHDFRSTGVRIRNISASGAMLEYSGSARVGAEPLLEFGSGASIGGTIAWAIGDHLGLRFHSDFNMEVLAESVPQVTSSHWTPPAHLSKVKDIGSPWHPRWNRFSVEELEQELAGYLKY